MEILKGTARNHGGNLWDFCARISKENWQKPWQISQEVLETRSPKEIWDSSPRLCQRRGKIWSLWSRTDLDTAHFWDSLHAVLNFRRRSVTQKFRVFFLQKFWESAILYNISPVPCVTESWASYRSEAPLVLLKGDGAWTMQTMYVR